MARAARGVGLMIGVVLLAGCGSPGDGDDTRRENVSAPSTPASTAAPAVGTVTGIDPEPERVIVDAAVLEGMVLHLSDAAEGARIGDDSECGGGLSTEGGSDPFLDLVGQAGGAIVGCFNQLESPEVSIDSLVVAFPNDDLAIRAVGPAAFDGIVRYYGLDCCANEVPGSVEATTGPGPVGVEAASESDSVAIVGWRSGRLIGAISVLHLDGAAGALAEAQALAVVQDARMRTPVPVPDDGDDDRLSGLHSAPFRTWWLGETFAPQGLPMMELIATYYRDGMAEIGYAGIRIEIFDLAAIPDGSESAQILGVANDLFDSPCTVTVPLQHRDGDAALLGRVVPDDFFRRPSQAEDSVGWGSLDDDECAEGQPNVWIASVRFDDGLLVRINAPLCYNCLAPPDPERPYNQPDGLRAIVTALTPYVR